MGTSLETKTPKTAPVVKKINAISINVVVVESIALDLQ